MNKTNWPQNGAEFFQKSICAIRFSLAVLYNATSGNVAEWYFCLAYWSDLNTKFSVCEISLLFWKCWKSLELRHFPLGMFCSRCHGKLYWSIIMCLILYLVTFIVVPVAMWVIARLGLAHSHHLLGALLLEGHLHQGGLCLDRGGGVRDGAHIYSHFLWIVTDVRKISTGWVRRNFTISLIMSYSPGNKYCQNTNLTSTQPQLQVGLIRIWLHTTTTTKERVHIMESIFAKFWSSNSNA